MLEKLINLFTGGVGGALGTAATFAGIIAALAGPAAFIFHDRNEVLIVVHVGDAAFWGLIIAANLFVAWLTRRGS